MRVDSRAVLNYEPPNGEHLYLSVNRGLLPVTDTEKHGLPIRFEVGDAREIQSNHTPDLCKLKVSVQAGPGTAAPKLVATVVFATFTFSEGAPLLEVVWFDGMVEPTGINR